MTDKTMISGAELAAGMTIKHPTHDRIYIVVHLEEPDRTGAIYGDFRQTNGEVVCFNVFSDSTYELRSSAPRPRHRMVKVRAADLAHLLRVASYEVHVPATGEAVARIREAVTG